MSTRREALRTLAAAAAFPIVNAQQQAAAPVKFFSSGDLQLLSKLVDVLIPSTDTPGAVDVGVPLYIDTIASRMQSKGELLRKGLSGLRAAGFEDATPERSIELIAKLSDSFDPFFQLAKDLTIEGYYSSREGLVTELGYHGNTYLSEFPGCAHPEHQVEKKSADAD